MINPTQGIPAWAYLAVGNIMARPEKPTASRHEALRHGMRDGPGADEGEKPSRACWPLYDERRRNLGAENHLFLLYDVIRDPRSSWPVTAISAQIKIHGDVDIIDQRARDIVYLDQHQSLLFLEASLIDSKTMLAQVSCNQAHTSYPPLTTNRGRLKTRITVTICLGRGVTFQMRNGGITASRAICPFFFFNTYARPQHTFLFITRTHQRFK